MSTRGRRMPRRSTCVRQTFADVRACVRTPRVASGPPELGNISERATAATRRSLSAFGPPESARSHGRQLARWLGRHPRQYQGWRGGVQDRASAYARWGSATPTSRPHSSLRLLIGSNTMPPLRSTVTLGPRTGAVGDGSARRDGRCRQAKRSLSQAADDLARFPSLDWR